VLASFGFDITAVLTTSAILTAAVGLAMQPTLGSLISGVALHMDRVLRVGDTIVLDDKLVEITRLDWRTAVGRRKDGTVVVVPNARISNETLVVYPAGRPVRLDTVFPAPATVPPQRITDLVAELIADFPQVDAGFPVMVMLDGHEPEHAAVRYRARYWIRNTWDRPEVGSEVLRRVWYAFQRQGIPWPVSRLYGPDRRMPHPGELAPGGRPLAEAVAAALPPAASGRGRAEAARRLAEGGELLLYAPDERIILPARCAGRVFLLLSGEARIEAGGAGVLADAAAPPLLRIQRLGRAATLRRVADALARNIGPYAEHAVRRAAARAPTPAELRREVAGEIVDPHRRERFLAELGEEGEASLGAGLVFRAKRDAVGRLGSDPPLCAVDEVAVLAVPPELAGLLANQPGAGAAAAPAAGTEGASSRRGGAWSTGALSMEEGAPGRPEQAADPHS
jgi:hypothetical protein